MKNSIKNQFSNLIGQILIQPELIYPNFSLLLDEIIEFFFLILLDDQHKIRKIKKIAEGTKWSLKIKPRLIFNHCFKENLNNLIIVHNHPSGNGFPSDDDIFYTALLRKRLFFFDVKLLDHIIISKRCFSFKKANLL